MPDISNLAIRIDSSGFLTARANAEMYVSAQKKAAQESTKYEQELQRLNDTLKRISDTGRYFNRSLDTIVQAQQSVQASMIQMIQSGDTSSQSLLKLAYQYNALGQEIQKLSGMQSIMESYDSEMKHLGVETSLFGESLEILQRKQNLAKTAMIQLISAGISPNSAEVTKLRNTYQELGETIDKIGKKSIMESYDSNMRQLGAETKLFGESVENLQRQQNLAKATMVQLVSAGISPNSVEVTKLRNTYQELGETIDKIGKKNTDLSNNFAAFSLITNKLPGPLKSIASGMMGMVDPATAAVGAVIGITEAVVNFGKSGIQAFSDFEMIRANLEIVTGSAQEASATFNQLREMAGRTPFDVEGLANAAVQLRQTGTSAQELIPTLTLLGNVAGGSTEKFNRIVANFAQINSVSQATTMDLRQFAMMGIPIYETLEKLGVTGTATAQDIQKAFQLMAGEGGTFFNAMSKGAETLQGKVTNLEGTWKSLQATIVDNTGLGDAIKYLADAFQFDLAYIDTFINKQRALEEATKAWESGIFTEAQALTVLNDKIKNIMPEYELLYDLVNEEGRTSRIYNADFIKVSETLAELRKQYDVYASIIDREKARTAELEKQRKLVEDVQKEYKSAQSFFDKLYAGTPEGRLQELINKRDEARKEYQKLLQGSQEIIPGYTIPHTGEWVPQETKDISSDPKKIEEARIGVAGLQKQINEMIASMNKAETPDWIKILQSNTGFSLKQMEGMWTGLKTGQSLPVIEQFERVIELRNEAGKAFAGLTGGDDLSVYQAEYDTWAKMVQNMMAIHEETLENGSKVWKRVWEENEQVFQEAITNMKRAQAQLNLANFDKYLSDLKEANKLSGMDVNERVVVDTKEKLQAAGVKDPTADQIQQVIAIQSKAVTDEYEKQLAIQEQLLSGKTSAKQLAIEQLQVEHGISEEAAQQVYELQNKINFDKHISDLEKASQLPLMSANERVWVNTEEKLQAAGVKDPTADQIQQVIAIQSKAVTDEYEKQLAIQEQLLSGKTSAKQLAIEQLQVEHGISEEAAQQVYELQNKINFDKHISDLEKASQLPLMSANERVWVNTEEKLQSAGVKDPTADQIQQVIAIQSKAVTDEYEKQLAIQEQLLSGKTSAKQLAIEQLQVEHGISEEAAEQLYKIQKQIDAYDQFNDSMTRIKETLMNIGVESTVSMLEDLGAALATGADAGDALGQSFKKVLQGILNMLPSQFISAGLQAIIMGNWPLGLGLIAAGGGMALVSGALGAGDDMAQKLKDEREEELERLERLNEQYSSLTDSIQENEEYYLKKRRELNADAGIEALSVNDMILTPRGNFSTSPDDYIIATKNPATLGSGGGAVVNIVVNNEAGDVASASAQSSMSPEGIAEIAVLIRKVVSGDIASGRLDGAFNAKQARDAGRRVTS